MSRYVYVVGAGPQGRIVVEIVRAMGREALVLDDNPALWGQDLCGARVAGGLAALPIGGEAAVALGRNPSRLNLMAEVTALGGVLVNAIHPSAVVMPSAVLGRGVTIHPGAIVNTGARLGDGVIVNTSAVVEHDSAIDDGASISPGALVGGRVRIGREAFIGAGAIILARLEIGEGAIVGAGSLVTRPVPARTIVFGSPARDRGIVDVNFDWKRVL